MKVNCPFCKNEGVLKLNGVTKRCDCNDKTYRIYKSNPLKTFKQYVTIINGTLEDVVNKLNIKNEKLLCKRVNQNTWNFTISDSETILLIEVK